MSDSNKQAGGGETDTETIPPPSDHILPAKSEDKLEIEKEEKEREAEEKAKIEGKEGDEDDEDETDRAESKGEREGERKKFKIRTPKFLRSISKERKKDREDRSTPKHGSDKNSDDKAEDDTSKEPLDNHDKDENEDDPKSEDEAEEGGGILETLKNSMPAFLGGGGGKKSKEKDSEKSEEEEEKELLKNEDKEEDPKEEESPKEKGKEETKSEREAKSDEEEKEEKKDTEKDTSSEDSKDTKKKTGFLESLKNVSTHVPVIFTRKPTDKVEDIESGERKKLLKANEDDEQNSPKAAGANDSSKDKKTDTAPNETGSLVKEKNETEKRDLEKGEGCKKEPPTGTKDQCVQQFHEMDRHKQLALCCIVTALILLILVIVLVAAFTPVGWANEARLIGGGKFIETHTTCGPVEGLVDGLDQFSFKGIPYAVPVVGTQRFTHSRAATNLAECFEGKFLAHGQNASAKCWRRYPNGEVNGNEDCLTLDIFTSNVVYNELMPVVVYIGGEDLYADIEAELKPNSALAKKHGVVFIDVNFRHGALGFTSLQSLAKRTYPQTSGNYGLGDIISALQWIQLNVQHFGGHPSKVTLLGRHSGASMIMALTGSPKARGLYTQAWITNPAGAFGNQTLKDANEQNKKILENVKCGKDEVDCLLDTAAEEITKAEPLEWIVDPELPMKSEKDHSWLTIDKEVIFESLPSYWHKTRFSNVAPLVFGANAQGMVNENNVAKLAWNETQEYVEHVDKFFSEFNDTLSELVLEHYNTTFTNKNWQAYASMVSDLRMICPLLETAQVASRNFVANVYAYVVTQPRTSDLGDVADRTLDIEAIFGLLNTNDASVRKFSKNMQDMFYQFVRDGTLPQNKDLTVGMYEVSEKISTQTNYPSCEFWRSVGMVTSHVYKY
ncbi:hypothetical protein TCAL_09914 [Tigriopus californicus]|uniref:Carboxylesterase type B domain-containing protein n=1 Tax=Tigriopus californicus TaxID=6832 RepID=A0A553P7F2_TIGCA|nr:neurotactin-like [Tigriopus californicus]XP_059079363.1 neurotactin-like [Tigriopus californicus]TRY73621.1 hypothetical protein TCAL_09914 [Tigriopus californicus]